jgi:hypothetical protein
MGGRVWRRPGGFVGDHRGPEQARANPVAFMALLGRVLPTQLTGDKDAPVQTVQRIERVVIEPKQEHPVYPLLTRPGQQDNKINKIN